MTFPSSMKLCLGFFFSSTWCRELLWEQDLIGLGSLSRSYRQLLDDKWATDAMNLVKVVATKMDYLLSIFSH